MTQTLTRPVATAQPTYEITDADKARLKKIAEAWKAYDGDFEPQFEKTPEGIDPNVVMNQCGPIVDTGVDFLFGQEVEISAEKAAPIEAQTILDKAWGEKEVRVPLLQDLAMNGAMGRNAFLRIMPSTDQITRATTYRLIPVDPAIVAGVQTAPQDCDTVLLYCIQYSTLEKDASGKSRTVYYREEIARIDPDGNPSQGKPNTKDTWEIQHWTAVSQKGAEPKLGDWTPDPGGAIAWNYPFPPLFHNKNLPRPNEFWGRADIRDDLIHMNESLNLDMSCIMSDQIINALPFIYGTSMGEGSIQRKAGHVIGLPLPDSKIVAVAVPTDIAGALEVASALLSGMDQASSVPGIATGRIKDLPRGTISGIALELFFMSLLKQNDKKRCLYGKLIIDVSKALLVLNGLSGEIGITLGWEDPLPHDDLPSVQAGISKKEIGISETTIQREQGYDPKEEFKIKLDEMKQKAQLMQAAQDALPPGMPGAPPLPNQPPPAAPVAPGQPPAGSPPTAIGGSKP